MDQNELWKILKKMGIPDHHTCLPRTCMQVKKQQLKPVMERTMYRLKTGKGVHLGCILLPRLFNFCAEYIMRNAGLGEAQVWIKIARRNINNLRLADDSTLMAESKEELKSPLMRVKEEIEKADLKLNIQKLRSWHPVPSLYGK